MKTNIQPSIIDRDGPFKEFKQDASIVSVKLKSGVIFNQLILLFPNEIIGMKNYSNIPFETNEILEVYQDDIDLVSRGEKDWLF